MMTVTKADDDSGKLMDGRGGVDTLTGAAGDDQLFGGDDRDHLFGEGGNDLLDGGRPATTIHGRRRWARTP